MCQVAYILEWPVCQKSRAADRKHPCREEKIIVNVRVGSGADHHADVHVFVLEIDVVLGGVQTDLCFRMGTLKTPKSWNEPPDGEGRIHLHGQYAWCLGSQYLIGPFGDLIEGRANEGVITGTDCR